ADIRQRMSQIKARLDSIGNKAVPGDIVRTPAFCSGCPHNTSTKVPEGSVSMAGIGCHTMAMWMPDRPTAPPTQMGGEGANWIGMAHFTDMQHVFQNMGDGTYFHSGLLAIRAAVAAQVNVTYKILFNSVVAMTGGQPFDGDLKITDIIAQVESEGVERIVVVSDEPDKYAGPTALPNSVSIHHRDALIGLEMELRDVPGVTVLIYDQGCATDKRRRRKRGQLPDPNTRYFINSDVCEGCGDCSTKSTCVSIAPKETPFGRKRRIDQSTCNKDYSCVKGFCPSFVTVTGARIRKRAAKPQTPDSSATMPKLPDPVIPKITDTYALLVAGIGGTGVVTIGAVLGMAAHLENKGCLLLDITGLAQKNGAVLSHVQFAQTPADLTSARVGPAQCDLMLACDVIVGSGPEALATLDETRSHVVANMRMTATAQFQFNPNLELDGQRFLKRLATSVGQGKATSIDASAAAERLLGDSIGANMFLVGVAYQQGRIPVSEAAILRALELNGVAVSLNVEAFQYGRLAAHEGEAFWQRLGGTPTTQQAVSETLDDVIARRVTGLKDYQNARYAEQFKQLIDQVRQVDADIAGHDLELTKAAAKSLYKLMAYKDEYEVARLYSRPEFRQELEAEFEGDYKIGFNLAPPLLTRKDPVTGHPKKIRFGAWMLTAFGVLAHGKHLRGTAFDIFGRTSERRMERRLIAEYRTMLEHIMRNLSADNYAAAVALANVPDEIRGYGHVKEANVKKAEDRRAQLLQEFAQPKQRRTIMAAAG
ncbi:MAG: indolepyruvate ferredoxin oxidoreductase family protein, partial [Pseudomonadota bacterium]